ITGDTLSTRTYYTAYLDQPCDPSSPDGQGPLPEGEYTHVYALGYGYDVAGRRTSMALPWQLTSGRVQQYHYDTQTSELTGITAPSSHSVGFSYDRQGRLARTLYPGSVKDTLMYDGDSRLRARKAATDFGTDYFSRDAQGRVLSTSVGTGAMNPYTAESWYGPMGAVVAAKNITYNPEADITGGVEEFRVDALGNRFWQRQRYVHPTGPDRDGIRTMSYSLGRLTDMNALPDAAFPNFIWSQGLAYDGAGNTTHSWTHRSEGTGGSAHVFESSRSYYDAAGRLRVTNKQLGLGPGTSPGGVWEEYRY